MVLHTVVRDCLYLNWALPRAALPAPPESLRYEVHRQGEEELVFVSALLFRQDGLRPGWLPLRLSYPQFNLRSYVVDGEGMPAVLFEQLLVPSWVTPAARWVGGVPCRAAALRYPRPSESAGAEGWSWRVARTDRSRFDVMARQAAPVAGVGPDLGDWQRTTDYFRRRDRGYLGGAGGLRRIDTAQRPVPLWPVQAQVRETSLLTACWPAALDWPPLHSSWLCPEIPLTFELVAARRAAVPRPVPAPS